MALDDQAWEKLQADWHQAVLDGQRAKASRRLQGRHAGWPIDTWQDAETAAAAHMYSLGFLDATKTDPGADSGIDVRARGASAQVKFRVSKSTRPELQQLHGASEPDSARLFYSTAGYTDQAVRFANSVRIALFILNVDGSVLPYNGMAESLAYQCGQASSRRGVRSSTAKRLSDAYSLFLSWRASRR